MNQSNTNKGKYRTLLATGLVALMSVVVAGVLWWSANFSPPSVQRQASEVAALQTLVLPAVEDLRVTRYFKAWPQGEKLLYWKRGKFTDDASRAGGDDGELFDDETRAAHERLTQAIRASGVPMEGLHDAQFAADGSLKSASFRRREGSIEINLMYIYSPGGKPSEWRSDLGPVVLTKIGETDWWLEQSPDD